MKITVAYSNQIDDLRQLKIDKAVYLSDFEISIQFNDGLKRIIDFKPFLTNAKHPSIKKYLDKNLFADFTLKNGNLNWNDYDLIFPVADLYNGKIST